MFQLSHYNRPFGLITLQLCNRYCQSSKLELTEVEDVTDNKSQAPTFRSLQLKPAVAERKTRRHEPKWKKMTTRRHVVNHTKLEEWSNVWPTAQTFHPDVVQLPLRQGWVKGKTLHPKAYANAELMKIPNFLHLTPPAIKKHCAAIKKFCTKWPEGLETEEKCTKHFPLEIITSDYCFSAANIREPLARIVTLRVKLSSLDLNHHAKDKLLRLLRDKYNPETDLITITADRCPVRKQNLDYVYYLLTALYHESWRVQPWETEKSLADMEEYDWEQNKSKIALVEYLSWPSKSVDIDTNEMPFAIQYKEAVTSLINNGEDEYSVNKYKEAVKHILEIAT